MLLAHARSLAEARTYLAGLADQAMTFEAAAEYEHALLQLDLLHHDDSPALLDAPDCGREQLQALAEARIEELTGHGVDALGIELVFDLLAAGRAHDRL